MNPSRSGEGDTKIVVITDETPEYAYKLLTEYLSNADKVQISTTGLENIKNNVDELFCTEELANDYNRTKLYRIVRECKRRWI